MRRSCWGLLLLAGVTLVAEARAQDAAPPRQEAREDATSRPPEAGVDTSTPPYDYLVAPGDVLRIMVWKEPALSTDATVRLDGKITVPLLGDVAAEGRTPEELTLAIQTGLRQFLSAPQVTVGVAQAPSARFYVIGEVAVSGAYPLAGRITVLQALALAGGFKEFAKRDRIRIIREHGGRREAILFNYEDMEDGIRLEQNIKLMPGDTVVVP